MSASQVPVHMQQTLIVATQQAPLHDWNNSIFGCCNDPGTCILTWCCPCYVQQQNFEMRNGMSGGSTCCTSMLLLMCCPCIWPCWSCGERKATRTKLNISGSDMEDLCCLCCCPVCTITQEHLELKGAPPTQQVMVTTTPNMSYQQGPVATG